MMGALPVLLADNRFDDGTPSATDTAAGYDVLNIRDGKSYTAWKAASSGTKYITVDCGTAKSVDALAIFKHNLNTCAATISVESSTTGAWAGEQVERLAGFTVTSNKAVFLLINTASVRYWRVKIVTASVAAQIAEMMLGVRVTFPYSPDTPFVPASVGIEAETNRSKTGQLVGTVVRFKPYEINAKWSNLTRSWVDTYFRPFYDNWASELKPFFFAWDITTYPTDIRFVTLDPGAKDEVPLSVLAYYDSITLPMVGVKE